MCRLEVPPHLVQLLAQAWSSSCKASTGNLARVTGTRSALALLHPLPDCLSIRLMGLILLPQTLQQLCHMAVYIGYAKCFRYITVHVPACNHTRCTFLHCLLALSAVHLRVNMAFTIAVIKPTLDCTMHGLYGSVAVLPYADAERADARDRRCRLHSCMASAP
jgi:hypothetical protein